MFNYPKNFALLQPTSPLRTSFHIKEASSIYHNKFAKSVVSIVEGKPIEWAYKIKKTQKIQKFINNKIDINRRQDTTKVFYPNGSIYICETDFFKE